VCKHDLILETIGIITDEGHEGIVMEFIEGETLEQCYNRGGMSLISKVSAVFQTACAIEFMHFKRHIHRDISCRNIIIDDRGKIKVGDFGLSRQSEIDGGVTVSIAGATRWMAPEQLRKPGTYSYSSDVYAFGATTSELFSEKVPHFECRDMNELKRKIAHEGCHPLVDTDWEEGIQILLKLTFIDDPFSRPNMTDCVESLKVILKELSPTTLARHDSVTLARHDSFPL